MKVLKFGGTSVGTVNSLLHVKSIVENRDEQLIIVVSALGGITDKLIATGRLAQEGNSAYIDSYKEIVKRHHDMIDSIIEPQKRLDVCSIVDSLLDDLSKLYYGVFLLRELSERTLASIVSFGERISSIIVCNTIKNAKHFNSLDFIKTERWFNKNIAATELTNALIVNTFSENNFKIAVIGGFISTDKETNDITNLGRGGSDYTAALLAAALDAEELEIWTDVDGFMTADPRIISKASVIDSLSFIESMELCSFGAKIVYPPTIYPVFHKNIPIRIKNTFNASANGSLIADCSSSTAMSIKGISTLAGISLISIIGSSEKDRTDFSSRTFNTLAKKGITILLTTQESVVGNIVFAISTTDKHQTLQILNDEFTTELASHEIKSIESKDELAILAIVGEKIVSSSGLPARMTATLQRNDIKVIATSTGTSKANISFIIAQSDAHQSLQIIHDALF